MVFCPIFASDVTLSETKVVNVISKLLVHALSPIDMYNTRFRDDFKFCPITIKIIIPMIFRLGLLFELLHQ